MPNSMQLTEQIPNDPPRMGAKSIPVPLYMYKHEARYDGEQKSLTYSSESGRIIRLTLLTLNSWAHLHPHR